MSDNPPIDRNAARAVASDKARTALAADAAMTSTSIKAQANKDRVFFVSSAPEPYCYELQVRGERYTGYWDDQRKHVCWDMNHEHAALFKEQHMFKTGRVIEVK